VTRNAVAPPLPHDAALRGFASALRPDLFAGLAARLLPPDARVVDCRLAYLRYKPGTNAVVLHELTLADRPAPVLVHAKCYTEDDYPVARKKADSLRLIETPCGLPAGRDDSARMLLFQFPNDQVLDGMRFATHPKKIQRALYAHDATIDEAAWRVSDSRLRISPVRFKPEKRAVLRIDTRARHRQSGEKRPVRVYARVAAGAGSAALTARLHREFADHPWLRTPRPIVHLPDQETTLVADLGGRTPDPDRPDVQAAGRALAALHSARDHALPPLSAEVLAAELTETFALMTSVAPGLEKGAAALMKALEPGLAAMSGCDDGGFVHGDFHPLQILELPDGAAVLDFDRSHAGDQAADLGNYRAHLIWRSLGTGGDPAEAAGRADALIAAYASVGGHRFAAERIAFWTSIGLVRLAPRPFRLLHPAWPDLTADLLAAAREELP